MVISGYFFKPLNTSCYSTDQIVAHLNTISVILSCILVSILVLAPRNVFSSLDLRNVIFLCYLLELAMQWSPFCVDQILVLLCNTTNFLVKVQFIEIRGIFFFCWWIDKICLYSGLVTHCACSLFQVTSSKTTSSRKLVTFVGVTSCNSLLDKLFLPRCVFLAEVIISYLSRIRHAVSWAVWQNSHLGACLRPSLVKWWSIFFWFVPYWALVVLRFFLGKVHCLSKLLAQQNRWGENWLLFFFCQNMKVARTFYKFHNFFFI